MVSTDQIVRLGTGYISKFFSKGWGNTDLLRRLAQFQLAVLDKRKVAAIYETIRKTDISITKVAQHKKHSTVKVYRGEFVSPLTKLVPNALPPSSEKVHFELVLPDDSKRSPVCIHLAGTGDHHFWWRKKSMAIPLVEEHNIGSILLENPFYGYRKPKDQVRSSVNYVSDIFVMGCALLVECITLFLWCQRNGYNLLGLTGISMGAHMATVASSGWPGPLAIVPCLSWTSAAPIYTEGVLFDGVHWDVLEKQLQENPEYKGLIRDDQEFKNLLQIHYKGKCARDSASAGNDITSGLQSRSELNDSSISSINDGIRKYMEPFQTFDSGLSNVKSIRNIFNGNKKTKKPSRETTDYMTAIMDQATHLSHFNKPHDASSVIYVVANHDKYINRDFYNVTPQDVWPQTEVRTIDCGHVVGCIMHQKIFRDAIRDAFERLARKQTALSNESYKI